MIDWQVARSLVSDPSPRGGAEWLVEARPAAGAPVSASLRIRIEADPGSTRHWFHLGRLVHRAPDIGTVLSQRTLTLCSDLCGATEILDCRDDGEAVSIVVRAAVL